jgi:hypothetical protein
MSYEGFESWLCRNVHYHHFECYNEPDAETWRCDICGEPRAYWRGFDCTNGCLDCPHYDKDNDETRCGESFFIVIKPMTRHQCCECGSIVVDSEPTYGVKS